MTNYKPEFLAKEADRLCSDVVLVKALGDLRQEALDDLARSDAGDTNTIIRLQQRALLADDILVQLRRYILAIGEE